jgi:DNA-binding CsgD family transcriptional regulator
LSKTPDEAMAAKTKTMNQIRLILQHHAQGFSGRDIAQRLAISRNTVSHYLGRFAASGQSSEALMALQDAALATQLPNPHPSLQLLNGKDNLCLGKPRLFHMLFLWVYSWKIAKISTLKRSSFLGEVTIACLRLCFGC